MKNFVRKPFLAIMALIFVVAAIVYIESQKPKSIGEAGNQQTAQKIGSKTSISGNKQDTESIKIQKIIDGKISKYPKAPNFKIIENWINSEPLNIEDLNGKVVLVDFWTYTCINCIRTLPYLKSWDEKYRDKGLVIVGVHTPEFNFERKYENVLKAVTDYKIKYPVAQDNGYATWNAYQNRYWPHKYLVDIDGFIVYDHIGEGDYMEIEEMIQKLLEERMERLNEKKNVSSEIVKPEGAIDVSSINVGTPEIYFGHQFDRGNLGYDGLKPDAVLDFKFPANPSKNYVYLDGKWKYNSDNMELIGDDGSIMLIYRAKNVNVVAGSDNGSGAVVFLDNDFENDKNKGNDVVISQNKSMAKINEFKLYNLVSGDDYETHVVQIDVIGEGFKIYTFTFG